MTLKHELITKQRAATEWCCFEWRIDVGSIYQIVTYLRPWKQNPNPIMIIERNPCKRKKVPGRTWIDHFKGSINLNYITLTLTGETPWSQDLQLLTSFFGRHAQFQKYDFLSACTYLYTSNFLSCTFVQKWFLGYTGTVRSYTCVVRVQVVVTICLFPAVPLVLRTLPSSSQHLPPFLGYHPTYFWKTYAWKCERAFQPLLRLLVTSMLSEVFQSLKQLCVILIGLMPPQIDD